MTDTATSSPRPWRIAKGLHEAIVDELNNVVACGSNAANAALIVDAVNERERLREERDRLRDLVKRMAAYIQVGAIGGALLREARAAIG